MGYLKYSLLIDFYYLISLTLSLFWWELNYLSIIKRRLNWLVRKKKQIMGDLFSTFNPITRIVYEFGGNWLRVVIPLLLIPQCYWLVIRQPLQFFKRIIDALLKELKAAITGLIPGILIIPLSFFFYLVRVNFMGITPYTFTASRHLRFTLSMAHLVPEGTPGALISLMVLIERVRLLIRPVA